MISGATRWYTVGGHLVTSVRTALSTTVARYGQVPGQIAWDDCTCDGVLAVSAPRIYRSETFPVPAEAPVGVRCQAPYEVGEFTVAVLRCLPQGDLSQELSIDASVLDTSAALLLRDTAESIDALMVTLCSLKDADTISDFMLGPSEAVGPEGACVGFNLQVLVSLEV